MGAQAVALAKAVGYDSAGTVEFVASQDKSFYFLEMNTRLQVEHPVTEMVTGIDLVEQMILSAAGEPLSLRQSDVTFSGWAIETRIYAEDPDRGFLPSTGRLVRYRPLAAIDAGPVSLRNDTGVEEGSEITIHYDPMISKLVTHAGTRLAAIDAQLDALDNYYVDGIRHNIPFLSAVMRHPRWRAGDLATGFIADEFPDGCSRQVPAGEHRTVLCAVAAAIDHLSNMRRRNISQQMSGAPVRFPGRRVVMLGQDACQVEVDGDLKDPVRVSLLDEDGKATETMLVVSEWWPGEPVWRGSIGGLQASVQVRPLLNGFELTHRGFVVPARVYTRREAELVTRIPARPPRDFSKLVLCPMPGLVRAIHVEQGQRVRAGDPLAVIEAMKMENVLRAERDGLVKKIGARPGDNLAVDHVIVELE
jgi:propionyl-CoA carboxylase alpha chain